MATVTKRELNQQTATVLELASKEGGVTVTERGRPRWLITPVSTWTDPIERAVREGRLTPAAATPPEWTTPQRAGRPAEEVDRLIADMKGDW
jgi:antitoxin (DNA-binding transcriptional repressor) of toxin-antitoxin stability system